METEPESQLALEFWVEDLHDEAFVHLVSLVRHERVPLLLVCKRISEIHMTMRMVNLYPAVEMSSAEYLVCNNFQGASKSLKICENIVRVSNSLDPGETPSYSASHPDPSCLHMGL